MAGTMANKAKRLWLELGLATRMWLCLWMWTRILLSQAPRGGLSGEGLAKRRTKILWLYYESGGHSVPATFLRCLRGSIVRDRAIVLETGLGVGFWVLSLEPHIAALGGHCGSLAVLCPCICASGCQRFQHTDYASETHTHTHMHTHT